ncbi:MAG: peptidoglycan bridge formation glycyltransferase FemA/FemB family protein [Micrococcaceae bacterium]
MLTVRKLTNTEFTEIADAHPDTFIPIEQSPEWDDYDHILGDRKLLGIYGYYQNNKLVATTRLTYFTLPMRNILLCVKGPVWFNEQTAEHEKELVDTMKNHFTKVEKLKITFIRMWLKNQVSGTNESFEPFLANKEIWVDINPEKHPTEDDLLKVYNSSTRRKVRKCIRDGKVEIKEISDLAERVKLFDDELMEIMEETRDRNNFYAHPKEIYQATLKALPKHAKLWVAYIDSKPASWILTTEYHGFATYLFGAGNAEARKINASYLLQFMAMRDLQTRGNTTYNLTGIESPEYPGLRSVTNFKRGFSKWEVELPLTYDVPISVLKYQLAVKSLAASRKLKSLRG